MFQSYENTLEKALFGEVLHNDSVSNKRRLLVRQKQLYSTRLKNFAKVHRLEWKISFILFPLNSEEKKYRSRIVINSLIGEKSVAFAFGKNEESARQCVCKKVLNGLVVEKELIKKGQSIFFF